MFRCDLCKKVSKPGDRWIANRVTAVACYTDSQLRRKNAADTWRLLRKNERYS